MGVTAEDVAPLIRVAVRLLRLAAGENTPLDPLAKKRLIASADVAERVGHEVAPDMFGDFDPYAVPPRS
ncbi:MAG: hypothetical protein AB7G39_15350 [Alphaproteobacteria bacterium]